MYEFDYSRPGSLAEAARVLTDNSEAKLLAGGMTLIPTLKFRLAKPSHIVDLSALPDLVGIKRSSNALTVGAMTTHAQVARSAEVRSAIPALAHLASGIGDPHVRHKGTIGGAIANNDPAADYPAALLALGATVTTNVREIAADDFFTGMFETALQAGEIVTSVTFPVTQRAAYIKFRNPASRYALVGVFAAEAPSGNRIAVTGAASCVFRQRDMEAAVAGGWKADVRNIKQSPDGFLSDIHGTAEYRAHLVGVLCQRAIASMISNEH